jgi:hypothetical protein
LSLKQPLSWFREYLTPEDPKPGRLYLLPKIHKENKPGRPIESANGHPTEKISEFIDFHLLSFVENLPSHIIDTTDYLKKMENLTDYSSCHLNNLFHGSDL